jgi:hypothetical protein
VEKKILPTAILGYIYSRATKILTHNSLHVLENWGGGGGGDLNPKKDAVQLL